jgi:hypothetical protein
LKPSRGARCEVTTGVSCTPDVWPTPSARLTDAQASGNSGAPFD